MVNVWEFVDEHPVFTVVLLLVMGTIALEMIKAIWH